MARARNHELGVGGLRDYRKAAELYSSACAQGKGRIAACYALLDAIMYARGVASDREAIHRLADALCERGDSLGCVYAEFMRIAAAEQAGQAEQAEPSPGIDKAVEDVKARCERGEGRVCELLAAFGGSSRSDSPTDIACQRGSAIACNYLVNELALCIGDDQEAACEAGVVARWKELDPEKVAIVERLRAWCKAGDARACEDLPGRSIPEEELCAAHDYRACAGLACFGDEAAADLARRHGAEANCSVVARRAHSRWLPHAALRPPPFAADERYEVPAPRPRPPLEAIQLWARGGRDTMDWPRYLAHNIGDQPVAELSVCAYAYDNQGRQLARAILDQVDGLPVAPGASVKFEFDRGDAPQFPRAGAFVQATYDRIRFSSSPAVIENRTRCPEQRPFAH